MDSVITSVGRNRTLESRRRGEAATFRSAGSGRRSQRSSWARTKAGRQICREVVSDRKISRVTAMKTPTAARNMVDARLVTTERCKPRIIPRDKSTRVAAREKKADGVGAEPDLRTIILFIVGRARIRRFGSARR